MKAVTAKRVLLVEDDAEVREAMSYLFMRSGYFVLPATTAVEALVVISHVPVDLVLSDVVLPMGSGLDVAEHVRRVRPMVPVVLMSAYLFVDLAEVRKLGVRHVLSKPVLPNQVLAVVAQALSEGCRERENLHGFHRRDWSVAGTIRAMLKVISLRDAHAFQHSRRVGRLARRLATSMGLGAVDVQTIAMAGWVHEVGKVMVPQGVLQKSAPLLPDELAVLGRHPDAGAGLLAGLGMPAAVVSAVRHHHDRFDGTASGPFPGTSHGLRGDQIPLAARVLAVVDEFDTMATESVSRKASLLGPALQQLEQLAGSRLDPSIVSIFLDMAERTLTP